MASVTNRINTINQPRGGYLKPSMLKVIQLEDDKTLNEENVHVSIVGMAVDYLTRYMLNKNKGADEIANLESSFAISIKGYKYRIKKLGEKVHQLDIKKKVDIESLLNNIKGLDDESIISACLAVTYDVYFRNPVAALHTPEVDTIEVDKMTIENISIMVNRSISFFDRYGPVIKDGFTFEGGYTSLIDSGDGDYLSNDTIWDFKVSKNKPTNKHTLQLLIYYIMAKHTKKKEFGNVSKIRIYNPRLNTMYTYDMAEMREDIIKEIEVEVIGYRNK